jgi:hypothetical protein
MMPPPAASLARLLLIAAAAAGAPPFFLTRFALCLCGVLYLLVASGHVVVAPARRRHRGLLPKVFCVGLSRTGTTSMTVALDALGYAVYHFCAPLVDLAAPPGQRLRRRYADCFDAHTDFAPALVYRELAAAYPTARFVLTTRDPAEWGRAMVRFTQGSAFNHWVLRLHPIASAYFAAMYGQGWHRFPASKWAELCEAHTAGVRAHFANEQRQQKSSSSTSRLLEICIADSAKKGVAWAQLAEFLEPPEPPPPPPPQSKSGSSAPPPPPFPHTDVFALTFGSQALRQCRALLDKLARPPRGWRGWLAVALAWVLGSLVAPIGPWCVVSLCFLPTRVQHLRDGATTNKNRETSRVRWVVVVLICCALQVRRWPVRPGVRRPLWWWWWWWRRRRRRRRRAGPAVPGCQRQRDGVAHTGVARRVHVRHGRQRRGAGKRRRRRWRRGGGAAVVAAQHVAVAVRDGGGVRAAAGGGGDDRVRSSPFLASFARTNRKCRARQTSAEARATHKQASREAKQCLPRLL